MFFGNVVAINMALRRDCSLLPRTARCGREGDGVGGDGEHGHLIRLEPQTGMGFCEAIDPPTLPIRDTEKTMFWRVIVRFSLDYDYESVVRNSVIAKLDGCGIKNTRTGVWESEACEIGPAAQKLTEIIRELAHISAQPGADTYLDHLWIYIDQVWKHPDNT